MPTVRQECVAFLQWALPRLGLRWCGFRRVCGQVCKRIRRRVAQLGLPDLAHYREHLSEHPDEWQILDRFCRITISRFYRDREAFGRLAREVLPELAAGVRARGRQRLHCWSVGCASGEEAHSVRIVWDLVLAQRFPGLELTVLATDVDLTVLHRAQRAYYEEASLKDLSPDLRQRAFTRRDGLFCLRPELRHGVRPVAQDVRRHLPAGTFELILCRNLVFTYFSEAQQCEVGSRLLARLAPGGCFFVGSHEVLPNGLVGGEVVDLGGGFYRRSGR